MIVFKSREGKGSSASLCLRGTTDIFLPGFLNVQWPMLFKIEFTKIQPKGLIGVLEVLDNWYIMKCQPNVDYLNHIMHLSLQQKVIKSTVKRF